MAKKKKGESSKITRTASFDKNHVYVSIAVIVLLSFFIYRESLNNSFTSWDDEEMAVNNPLVQNLSFGKIGEIFSSYHLSHYTPLVMLSYAIENKFFGLDPKAYHVTNLILHIFNSILVFLIFLKLSNKIPIALIVGVLFAVHPIHAESVVWIAERKDMLYSFFYLWAVLVYISCRIKNSFKKQLLLYVLFLLSCLSKASAVTLPLVLVLIDYFFERKISLSRLKDKIPLFAVSIIFGIVNIFAQYSALNTGNTLGLPSFGILDRVLFMFYNYAFYIVKIIYPVNLSAFYPYPDPQSGSLPLVFYLSPLAAVIIVLAVKYSLKFDNKIALGILFYTVTILPILQLLPVGRTLSADRFAYIPSIGLFYIVSVAVYYVHSVVLKKKEFKYALTALVAFVVLILSYSAHKQSLIWKDSMTLYSDMIAKYPETFIAYNNRGTIYASGGNLTAAESDFMNAVKYNDKYPAAYNNLGLIKQRRTDFAKAIEYFDRAISLSPDYVEAYFNKGVSLSSLNRIDEAIEQYKKALEIDPKSVQALNALGKAYGKKGDINEAVSCFIKAVEIDPAFASAYFNLGVTYIKSGNEQKGIDALKSAARLGYPPAMEYLKSKNIVW